MTPINEQWTCAQVEAHLVAYLDGSLPVPTQYMMQSHLAQCAACVASMQEARQIAADLRDVAQQQFLAPLSAAAALRIQVQVYRRMRRALWWQRIQEWLQMAGTVAVTAVAILLLALFASQWLSFVATPAPVFDAPTSPPAAAESVTVALAQPDEETAVLPTRVPILADRLVEIPPPPALQSATPGSTPAEVATAVFAATFAGDQARLEQLFQAMRSIRQPTVRLWLHLDDRCAHMETPTDLHFKVVPSHPTLIARVDVYDSAGYAGELKMRYLDGEWFTVFTSYPRLFSCLSGRLH